MFSDYASSMSFDSRSDHSDVFASFGGARDADVELIVRSKLRRAARQSGEDADRLTRQLLNMLGESINSFTGRPRAERDAIVRKITRQLRQAYRGFEASRMKNGLNTHAADIIPTLAESCG